MIRALFFTFSFELVVNCSCRYEILFILLKFHFIASILIGWMAAKLDDQFDTIEVFPCNEIQKSLKQAVGQSLNSFHELYSVHVLILFVFIFFLCIKQKISNNNNNAQCNKLMYE